VDGPTSSLQWRYSQVYGYLRRRLGSDDRTQELTQDVFASAAAALNGSAEGDYPLPLLYTIAKRRFADEIRRRKRAERATLVLAASRRGGESTDYGSSIARALRDAMLRLAPEQREIVSWKLLEGRTFSEISARKGLSEGACKMRFTRALRLLRIELEKEGIEP
jgi:RNA polymerase sigma factor (sigma-70 family)